MKLFQILILTFCLGIFLIPKGQFYVQNMTETCCKNDQKSKNCCKDHSSHNKETNHKKTSCNENCSTLCITCYTFIESPFSESFFLELSYYKANKNLQFQYSDPHISDRLKEIWQPPKIA
ncbi:hypothetical protein D1631_02345 [Chryseobacterium nematophagum]|uniref:Uncharacterized protein n=2 Tax=Chryseobacterium nematophagum TaxID=2305228 RepID=A0A3M7TDA9_9FLAO|nr:hypothetical protein D1631_02345 [Chryseobacterium nematophagum]